MLIKDIFEIPIKDGTGKTESHRGTNSTAQDGNDDSPKQVMAPPLQHAFRPFANLIGCCDDFGLPALGDQRLSFQNDFLPVLISADFVSTDEFRRHGSVTPRTADYFDVFLNSLKTPVLRETSGKHRSKIFFVNPVAHWKQWMLNNR